jgi:hypothetical protein
MKTIAGLFDDLNAAHDAVRDLRDLGLGSSDVSLVAHDVAGQYGQSLNRGDWTAPTQDATATGAGMGAVLGGLAGLVVGLGALVIPGIGPVLAAGPLATVLSGIFGATWACPKTTRSFTPRACGAAARWSPSMRPTTRSRRCARCLIATALWISSAA